MHDDRFSPPAIAVAVLGGCLLAVAFGLAVAEKFYGLAIPGASVVLAVLAGAGGLSLGAFLVIATPGLR